MKRSPLIAFIIAISFLLYSCNSEFPAAYSKYSFSKAQLQRGIVNKYYTSYIAHADNNHGDVNYELYQLLPQDTLLKVVYDAAKHVRSKTKKIISEEGLKNITHNYYNGQNITPFELTLQEPMRWEEGKVYKRIRSYINRDYKITLTTQDSIGAEIDYRNLKVREVYKKTKREVYENGEFSFASNWEERELHAKDIGLIYRENKNDNYDTEVELVEQMSLSDFEDIEIPYKNRIPYIDPDESWSPEGFQVCNDRISIYYYWETPELHGGKKELEDFVKERYEAEKYIGQSGYLSIHFVINCRGETGRFVDRSHSLDFKEDNFSTEIKADMMSIMKEKKDWIAQLNPNTDEHLDVYYYTTFRIVNGAIDEILP